MCKVVEQNGTRPYPRRYLTKRTARAIVYPKVGKLVRDWGTGILEYTVYLVGLVYRVVVYCF